MQPASAASLLRFERDQALVRVSQLPAFLTWNLRRTPGIWAKFRRVGAMALFARPGTGSADPARLEPFLTDPRAGWIRYGSDGGRVQLFDAERRTVTKLALVPHPERVEAEIQARGRMGRAVPELLEWDAAQGRLVERWVDLDPVPFGWAALAEALALLKTSLYASVSVPLSNYLPRLAVAWDPARAAAFLESRGLVQVPVGPVHGDLWRGNLGRDRGGHLVLLDWEYTRTCVESQDLWTFLMQGCWASGRPMDEAFHRDLAAGLALLWGAECDIATAEAHHLIHLAERYAFFHAMNLSHKAEELCFLRGQIDALLEHP